MVSSDSVEWILGLFNVPGDKAYWGKVRWGWVVNYKYFLLNVFPFEVLHIRKLWLLGAEDFKDFKKKLPSEPKNEKKRETQTNLILLAKGPNKW